MILLFSRLLGIFSKTLKSKYFLCLKLGSIIDMIFFFFYFLAAESIAISQTSPVPYK